MSSEAEPPLGERPYRQAAARVVLLAGLVCVGLGGLSLTGWLSGVVALRAPFPGAPAMAPNSALGLTVAGAALLALRGGGGRRRLAVVAGGLLVATLGALALLEHAMGARLAIDRLLVGAGDPAVGSDEGRLAPQVAGAFVLGGAPLALVGLRRGTGRAVELPALALLGLAMLVLAGHLYDVERLYQLPGGRPVAPHTAAALLALAVGIIAASRGRLAAALSGPGAGSVAARRLIPLVVVGLPLLAILRQSGVAGGIVGPDEGEALLVLAQVALVGSGILIMARLLNEADHERERARADLEVTVQRRTAELAASRLETLERLARVAEYRDDDTFHHTERVGRLAELLALELGLPADEVERIRRAAPLHDVGKVAVPDEILHKSGPLTMEEFERVKDHTMAGATILMGSGFDVLQLAERVALYHHERWDGGGYPMGLAGEEIPLVARIVAVADVFDALTHDRPYKAAWSRDEAVAEIERTSGGQFDPRVVACVLALDRSGRLDEIVPHIVLA